MASSSNNNKKKTKGGQLTLEGRAAFNPQKDCVVCRARYLATIVQGARIPNRAHHVLCSRNKTTKGLGVVSEQNLATTVEDRRLKELFERPLTMEEKASSKHCTAAAAQTFFAPRKKPATTSQPKDDEAQELTTKIPIDFFDGVSNRVADASFREKHKAKSAPLAMVAFAGIVVEQIVKSTEFLKYFTGITMAVPPSKAAFNNPHYHSIIGQQLLYVDWNHCGIAISCPDRNCKGTLKNERTNYSKNKTLFPLFGLDGPPSWCIVMKMSCPCCKRCFDSNSREVLLSLPAYLANQYPVETKFALPNHSFHMTRDATDVLDQLMLTYGNGEMCSKLLYTSINTTYIRKITDYISYPQAHRGSETVAPYIVKDGVYIKQYPPWGETIRDVYNEAATSPHNQWGISDRDRHTREIQSVACKGGTFAQDHTFEVIKNYQSVGATAVWDVAIDTGEIATAVCVPTTQIIHFSHAVKALQKRPGFDPSATYSDTWPCKETYWNSLWPNIKGRLGLFHYEKRILRTIRKNHIDFHSAVTDLMDAIYEFESTDYEKVLVALKDGSIGKKHTTQDIVTLKTTKYFRDRYGKYLRKRLHHPNTMIQRLDDWFCKYKVTTSRGRPARGRLDPTKGITLFTAETKTAVDNCKDKAIHLSDPLPMEEMYFPIPPNPNSRHQLTECLSKRGESKLESFHDRLSNFANSGVRDELADNLHLTGTARYNLSIRHKRLFLTRITNDDRKHMPAAWEKVVPYWNHSELWNINLMAKDIGIAMPFPMAEKLPQDNGERFFSEYMKLVEPMKQRYVGDQCQCNACAGSIQQQQQPTTTTTTTTTTKPKEQQTIQRISNQIVNPIPPPLPMAMAPTFNPFLPYPWMQQPMPIYCIPQQPTACCSKYMHWLSSNRRIGRPPHDSTCYHRNGRQWTGRPENGSQIMRNCNNGNFSL